MTAVLRRLGGSQVMLLASILLAAAALVLALAPVPAQVVGVLVLVLEAALWWVGRHRSGQVLSCLAVAALLIALVALAVHDLATAWLIPGVVLATVAGLVDEVLRRRLVPRVRTAQLPGIPDDLRLEEPGPLVPIPQAGGALLGLALILTTAVPHVVAGVVLLVLVLAVAGWCVARLRSEVAGRRRGTVNEHVTRALTAYAPTFFIYFSGPAEGDYQIRMWLPYLERLGVPFAILTRSEPLLRRAARFGSVPVVSSPHMAGLDACMVPSVRAVFYVNSNAQCVDGVRYLDRTHVQLNHGDSDKPSSYHPMYAMFDQVFVAGQAAVDRFARHGVAMPADTLVCVGRPQVDDIVDRNVEPVPGRVTVLYAPTWRGGVNDMNLSSLASGETVVRMLLDRGVRVMFRPHPLSTRDKASAAAITRIDEMLRQHSTAERPHLTSADTAASTIVDCFNRCDVLVADVSSVVSDFLASGKPMAVVDPGGRRGERALDAQQSPVLQAAYVLDPGDDSPTALDDLLGADSLAPIRRELRTYYLGSAHPSAPVFLDAAARALC